MITSTFGVIVTVGGGLFFLLLAFLACKYAVDLDEHKDTSFKSAAFALAFGLCVVASIFLLALYSARDVTAEQIRKMEIRCANNTPTPFRLQHDSCGHENICYKSYNVAHGFDGVE